MKTYPRPAAFVLPVVLAAALRLPAAVQEMDLIWGANFDKKSDIINLFSTAQRPNNVPGLSSLRVERNKYVKRPKMGYFALQGKMHDDPLFTSVPENASLVIVYRLNMLVRKMRIKIQCSTSPADTVIADVEKLPVTDKWRYLPIPFKQFHSINNKPVAYPINGHLIGVYLQPIRRGDKVEMDIQSILIVTGMKPGGDVAGMLEQLINESRIKNAMADYEGYELSADIIRQLKKHYKGERDAKSVVLVGGRFVKNSKFLKPMVSSVLKGYTINSSTCTGAKGVLSKMRVSLRKLLTKKKPEFVIIAIGSETLLKEGWLKQVQEHGAGMVRDVQAAGAIPILTTFAGKREGHEIATAIDEFEPQLVAMARKLRVPYLDLYELLHTLNSPDEELWKNSTPNAEGFKKINEPAARLLLILERYITGRDVNIPGEETTTQHFLEEPDTTGIEIGDGFDLDE